MTVIDLLPHTFKFIHSFMHQQLTTLFLYWKVFVWCVITLFLSLL